MRRAAFKFKVKKEKIPQYKEAHRNVWPDVCEALKKNGWSNYSLYMDAEGLVFGYFETDTNFAGALAGFAKDEAATRWGEAMGELVEIPADTAIKDVIIELEEVFHLD